MAEYLSWEDDADRFRIRPKYINMYLHPWILLEGFKVEIKVD